MWVHWHPDNIVYVRDSNNNVLYSAPVDILNQDLGQVISDLPESVIERQYYPETFCSDFIRSGRIDGPNVWEDGDEIILNLQLLQAAVTLRNTPAVEV